MSEALARFPDSVCPSSEGVPLDDDARIVARIRADVQAAVGKTTNQIAD